MRRGARSARALLATLLAPAREPTAGSAIRGNMTSHVAPRAISSCLALRGDGNAALAGSFRARAAWASPFHRRAVSRAPSLRRARSVALAAGESAPSGARAESVSSSDSWREDAARRAAGLGAAAAAAEAETLAAEIAKHDALYYLDADPEISDAAYDRLRVRLEALEEAHPGARRRDSPTGRVGAVVNVVDGASALESSSAADAKAHARFSALARAAHVAPMRSLSNVFTDEEARAWERKLRRALGGAWRDEVFEKKTAAEAAETAPAGDASFDRDETAIAFVAEPKIDGASVSVTYVGGVLKKCVSRGDGLVGEDVTNQLAGCVGVPKTLLVSEKSNPGKTCSRDEIASDESRGDDRRDDDRRDSVNTPVGKIPGYLEVRGEVFIADADFARVNERRLERGLVPFKSARNAVAGAMRRLDPPAGDGTDAGPLRFAAYAWGAVFEDAIDSPTGDSRNENENETAFSREAREDGPRDPDDAATTFWRSQREFKAFAARLGFDPVPTLAAGDGVRAVLRAHETLAREREAALLCREAAAREEEGDGGDGRAEGVLEEQKQKQKMSFGYAVDGVVYKVDDVSLQRRLGADARAPRWATAHKFQAATAVTTLAAIEVQVGRTGALTPVAVLHPPAELGGASVRRATLHNFHDLERKKLHRAVGRRVLVERAGDVIPRVVGVAEAFGEDDEDDTTAQDAPPIYRPPTTCPSCGSAARASPLIETRDAPGTSAAVLRCVGGLRCPAQATERIAHFVSRDALDVSGLAKTQIAAMLAEGIVTSPADLFTLRARFDRALSDAAADNETRDAASLEAIPARWLYASGARAGTLKRSATKLFDALDDVKARGVPLRRFLFALGIRGVGRETAAALAKTFGTLEAFREAASWEAERARIAGNDGNDATSRLTSIDGVGPAVAATVGEFFAEPANVAALDATLANGVRVLPDDDDDASKASRDETRNVDAAAFEGLRVVVTGAVPGMTRAEALAAVARAGGVAQKAVSGKTDVLVAGDGAGRRKAEAAAERGARVIDARTFLETLFPDASDARER